MRWFGDSWGAPVCHPMDHTATPIGASCIYCPRTITDGDQGFALPHVTNDAGPIVVYAHLDCLVRAVLGPDHSERVPT